MVKHQSRLIIGWREWIVLPDLGVKAIKAKIDTGARSSAIHAFNIERFSRGEQDFVRFQMHPMQRESKHTVTAEAPLLDQRQIRNSGGHAELRLVILTHVELKDHRWPIELTLTNRDVMGFRMLLGRAAVREHFLVDPGRSYLLSDKPKIVEDQELEEMEAED